MGTSIASVLMSFFLTACWDKIEMNELALVSMVGMDSDPDTGQKTIYYQVVNPASSVSAKGSPGGDQAPVYTYEISGPSFGEIRSLAYEVLPRKLFVAHYKAIVVSQRAAEQGMRDIINFIEMQPNGRASVPMLVADGPLSPVMRTFTPLERVPADDVESRLKLLTRESLMVGKHIRLKDVDERMQQSRAVVLPIIRERLGNKPQDSGARASEINASIGNLQIEEGAVIQNYRMVGRLNDTDLIWYHLLVGDKGKQAKQFQVNGKRLTLEMEQVRFNRSATCRNNRPLVSIRMDLEISSRLASDYVPQSWNETAQLQKQVSQTITQELEDFYEKTKKKGWDLLEIRETVRSHLPRSGPNFLAGGDWNDVDVSIGVNVQFRRIGSIHKL